MERYFNIKNTGLTEPDWPSAQGWLDTPEQRFITCDSWQLARINGVICHETGRRNSSKTWKGGAWIRYIECRACGFGVREGEVCDCQRSDEESVC